MIPDDSISHSMIPGIRTLFSILLYPALATLIPINSFTIFEFFLLTKVFQCIFCPCISVYHIFKGQMANSYIQQNIKVTQSSTDS